MEVPKDRAFWEKAAEEYDSKSKIAGKLGCSRSTVRRHLARHGLKMKKQPANTPKDIPTEEVEQALRVFGSVRKAATHLGCNWRWLYDYIEKIGINLRGCLQDYQDNIAPNQDQLLLQVRGPCAIASDLHSPFTSLEWTNRLIETSREHGVNQLVLGGDEFDFDQLSYWAWQARAMKDTVSLEDEFTFGESLFDLLEQQFSRIYLVRSNHWMRLLRQIGTSIEGERVLGLIRRFDTTRYSVSPAHHWLLIDGLVRVTHPKQTRKLDGTLARDIAIKFPGQWIVVAHRHRAFSGFTPDGGRPMLELGWLGDEKRMRYKQHVDTAHYEWNNSFAIYKDKTLMHFTETHDFQFAHKT